MHIYYFYKDGFTYVLDKDYKLYRYTVKHNLELILEHENILYEFKQELNEEATKFSFRTLKELKAKELYSLTNNLLYLSMLEYKYLGELAIPTLALEGIIGNIINHAYTKKKEETTYNDVYYGTLLERKIKEIEEKLEFLKNLTPYQKEEVSLEYLDPDIPKYDLTDIETHINEYYNEVNNELQINLKPNRMFNDPLTMVNLNEYDLSKEFIEELKEKRKIVNLYQKNYPKEVQEKIKFYNMKLANEILFYITNITLTIPCLIPLIAKITPSIINTNKNNMSFLIILNSIFGFLYYATNKTLKKMNNPTLTLKKEENK